MSAITDFAAEFSPIGAKAKNGKPKIVKLGDNYARAYWTGSMWAYDFGPSDQAVHQIDFEPTHYREFSQ